MGSDGGDLICCCELAAGRMVILGPAGIGVAQGNPIGSSAWTWVTHDLC